MAKEVAFRSSLYLEFFWKSYIIKYLTVEFLKFIRKEKKFKNTEQLKKQIKKDIINCQESIIMSKSQIYNLPKNSFFYEG